MGRIDIDLEEVLLNTHSIEGVREAQCYDSDEVSCRCGWSGRPDSFGTHLLVALGLTERVLADWKRQLARGPWVMLPGGVAAGPSTAVDTHPLQDVEYLNIFRGPKDQVRLTKDDRRELAALWKGGA